MFNFDRKSNIYIYGCGSLGQSTFNRLISHGYTCLGFIDSNANNIQLKNIDVFDLEKANAIIDRDSIIVISVHNALWHNDITKKLYSFGFKKMLFIPIGDDYSPKLSLTMLEKYKYFEENEFDKIISVPSFDEMISIETNPIIIEYDDSFVWWIDVTSLYSSVSLESAQKKGAPKELCNYFETPIPGMKMYIDLFRSIDDANKSPDLFLQLMKKFQNSNDIYSNDEFINDRISLFYLLEKELNLGMNRFILSAPEAVYFKNKIHLLDGMSRTSFLYVKGHQFVPIKTTKRDYYLYSRNIRVSDDFSLHWDVEHPLFFGKKVFDNGHKIRILGAIEEFFGPEKFRDKTILDLTNTNGCISRYFARTNGIVFCKSFNYSLDSFLIDCFNLPTFHLFSNISSLLNDQIHFDIVIFGYPFNDSKEKSIVSESLINGCLSFCLCDDKYSTKICETFKQNQAVFLKRINGEHPISLILFNGGK